MLTHIITIDDHTFADGGVLFTWSVTGPVDAASRYVHFLGSGTAASWGEANATARAYIAERVA